MIWAEVSRSLQEMCDPHGLVPARRLYPLSVSVVFQLPEVQPLGTVSGLESSIGFEGIRGSVLCSPRTMTLVAAAILVVSHALL